MLDLTGGLDNLMVGVTSLWLRLCAGETGGEYEALVGDFKVTLDLEAKVEFESGLDNMSGMRPLAIFSLFLGYAACTNPPKREELIRAWVEAENRLGGGGGGN